MHSFIHTHIIHTLVHTFLHAYRYESLGSLLITCCRSNEPAIIIILNRSKTHMKSKPASNSNCILATYFLNNCVS